MLNVDMLTVVPLKPIPINFTVVFYTVISL